MIINNGIISQGNHNINTLHLDYDFSSILKEVSCLEKYTEEEFQNIKMACENEDGRQLINSIRNLKKETIGLIKRLGLKTLETLIEKIIL